MKVTASPSDPRGRIWITIDGTAAGYVRPERGGTWTAAPEVLAEGQSIYLPLVYGLPSREAAIDRLVAEVGDRRKR